MVPCHVYRCSRRPFTYLYLRPELALDDLPEALAALFEGSEMIMELELTPGRTLAQADVHQVMAQLEDPGYFLQMPPEDDPSGWLDLPSRAG